MIYAENIPISFMKTSFNYFNYIELILIPAHLNIIYGCIHAQITFSKKEEKTKGDVMIVFSIRSTARDLHSTPSAGWMGVFNEMSGLINACCLFIFPLLPLRLLLLLPQPLLWLLLTFVSERFIYPFIR